jgi:glutaredoxin
MSDEAGAAVLYGRPGCPLCFALKRSASRAAARHGIPLKIVDVLSDAALASRYASDVPVLVLPGGRVLQGCVAAGEVDSAFRAAARLAGGAPGPRWLRRILGSRRLGDGAET